MKKRTYQTVPIQEVRLKELFAVFATGCLVAIDVAKEKMVVAFALPTGETQRLMRFSHPTETQLFLELLQTLQSTVPREHLRVVMEPTGTYGDALCYQVERLGVPVELIAPQRTHDSQALFDGVASLHDSKSAVLLARLSALGLGRPKPAQDEARARLRALVDQRGYAQEREQEALQQLEAKLARYWPELGLWLNPHVQQSALHLLAAYGSPQSVTEFPAQVQDLLRRTSHGQLSAELLEGVVSDARTSLGVPPTKEEQSFVQQLATEALEARARQAKIDNALHARLADDPGAVALERWLGTFTAAALVALCDPRNYRSADQLEKACGLNLREKSSGQYQGRLGLTKRGPALVRRLLYLAALRQLQAEPLLRAWYEKRQGYRKESKVSAVVAVMRKLVRAAFQVAKGQKFDATKLFDVRRLTREELPQKARPRVVTRKQRRRQPTAYVKTAAES